MINPTLQVIPGSALGQIALDDSLYHVLNLLRAGRKSFSGFSVVYSDESLHSSHIIVNIDIGVRLRFESASQKLRLIEVLDFAGCRMTYNGGEVSRSGKPSFRSVYKLFGPTYPGDYDEEHEQYVVSWPGVAFTFPLPIHLYKKDLDFVSTLSAPSALPATAMAIFQGSNWGEAQAKLGDIVGRPQSSSSRSRGSQRCGDVERVVVHVGSHAAIETGLDTPTSTIYFGSSTVQDVVMELGPPEEVFKKYDNRMNIHRVDRKASPSSSLGDIESDDHAEADYFYNYFKNGIDVLFDGREHVVKQVVLHGNLPAAFDFQRWRRVQWTAQIPDRDDCHTEDSITSEMEFGQVKTKLSRRYGGAGDPMILNRGSNSPTSSCELVGDGEEGKEMSNTAWATTELYGWPNMIFEVLRGSGISRLTVF
ncbi:UPF0183-domain-containing protein [Saitoella complicata NRRL Y-17804]|uniref:Uncharacterized protein n=1 Tax=Saitoella complicata (strain BCRC 22490 / CBS 7301 / JCM 7358 / NBRC 10748 / NRRL Y-17804) TaxID=698492 RepID=A0A0E9NH86_SAICN|nr:UPF0183-domain-containing protein [Saitoella complicata NRRL Y-17804]ODQ51189.1 UPF0183-domain-containing protein [Saitoella complicata NRRL Y-17804]GAO49247.1 hypothetical protein G7K_3400-t1 [Saitoella complicata NRRL Y-17804]